MQTIARIKTINPNNILSLENKEKEREKALKALERAKKIPRKVKFLPMGASGSKECIKMKTVRDENNR